MSRTWRGRNAFIESLFELECLLEDERLARSP